MEVIGYFAGLLTLLGYLPQTFKTIRTRRAKDLSLSAFLIIGTSATLWTIYGLGTGKPAIWLTNSVVAICSCIIVLIKLSV